MLTIADIMFLDLSAAVDVYSDWVDACDAVAKDAAHGYEERDARGINLHDNPVSSEPQKAGIIVGEGASNDNDGY